MFPFCSQHVRLKLNSCKKFLWRKLHTIKKDINIGITTTTLQYNTFIRCGTKTGHHFETNSIGKYCTNVFSYHIFPITSVLGKTRTDKTNLNLSLIVIMQNIECTTTFFLFLRTFDCFDCKSETHLEKYFFVNVFPKAPTGHQCSDSRWWLPLRAGWTGASCSLWPIASQWSCYTCAWISYYNLQHTLHPHIPISLWP